MKLLSATVTAALAAGLMLAGNAQAQGFFIDGRAGQSDLKDVDGADEDTAFTFGAGYWFNNYFAVEGGYARVYDKDGIDLDGYYAGVKGRYLFDRGDATGFFLGARGGGYLWNGKVEDIDGTTLFDDDGTDWYAGAFAGYQFTPNWNVSLNYDRFRADDLDTDLVSAGVEYKF